MKKPLLLIRTCFLALAALCVGGFAYSGKKGQGSEESSSVDAKKGSQKYTEENIEPIKEKTSSSHDQPLPGPWTNATTKYYTIGSAQSDPNRRATFWIVKGILYYRNTWDGLGNRPSER